MSKTRKRRPEGTRAESAVDPERVAIYRRAARAAGSRELVGKLRRLTDDYGALAQAGRHLLAMGAAVELLDVALRIATTPSPDARDWEKKVEFFERLFPSMAETLRHPHAARVALAALDAERALRAGGSGTRR